MPTRIEYSPLLHVIYHRLFRWTTFTPAGVSGSMCKLWQSSHFQLGCCFSLDLLFLLSGTDQFWMLIRYPISVVVSSHQWILNLYHTDIETHGVFIWQQWWVCTALQCEIVLNLKRSKPCIRHLTAARGRERGISWSIIFSIFVPMCSCY